MSPAEARKLLGGYATRTLTEDERSALFEAALKDQQLFEELLREQGMQELMDDPVSRAGLLAAVEAAPRRAWWIPAGAFAAAACLAVVWLLNWNTRPPQQKQMAYVPKQSAAPPIRPETTLRENEEISRSHLRKNAAVPKATVPAPPPLPRATQMVEVQADSAAPRAAPMSVAASVQAPLPLALTHSGEAVHPGDEVRVTAVAGSAGFVYLYKREDEGPWSAVEGAQGIDMAPGQTRLMPPIHVPEGISRITIVAFLTAGKESHPNPDLSRPDDIKTELVLDVTQQ